MSEDVKAFVGAAVEIGRELARLTKKYDPGSVHVRDQAHAEIRDILRQVGCEMSCCPHVVELLTLGAEMGIGMLLRRLGLRGDGDAELNRAMAVSTLAAAVADVKEAR